MKAVANTRMQIVYFHLRTMYRARRNERVSRNRLRVFPILATLLAMKKIFRTLAVSVATAGLIVAGASQAFASPVSHGGSQGQPSCVSYGDQNTDQNTDGGNNHGNPQKQCCPSSWGQTASTVTGINLPLNGKPGGHVNPGGPELPGGSSCSCTHGSGIQMEGTSGTWGQGSNCQDPCPPVKAKPSPPKQDPCPPRHSGPCKNHGKPAHGKPCQPHGSSHPK